MGKADFATKICSRQSVMTILIQKKCSRQCAEANSSQKDLLSMSKADFMELCFVRQRGDNKKNIF